MRRWKKNVTRKLNALAEDHLELSFCPECWATIWRPLKNAHERWHDQENEKHELG